MKSVLKFIKRNFLMMSLLMSLTCVSAEAYAQGGKMGGLNISYEKIETQAQKGADTVKSVAFYILAAVLAIGLVFVIYALATSNPKAKEYLIGWIIAVIVIAVANMLFQ